MNLMEFVPFGLSFATVDSRPVFLLKTEDEKQTLPIWLTSIEAAMMVAGLNVGNSGREPHTLLHQVLAESQWSQPEARFLTLQGHHQYLELVFHTSFGRRQLRLRADESMSACVSIGCRFFASDEFVAATRDAMGDMALIEVGLQAHPQIRSRGHHYLM